MNLPDLEKVSDLWEETRVPSLFSFIPARVIFFFPPSFFSDAKGSSSHVREKKFIKRGRRSHYPPPSLLVGASYHIESNLLIRPPARRDFARRLT